MKATGRAVTLVAMVGWLAACQGVGPLVPAPMGGAPSPGVGEASPGTTEASPGEAASSGLPAIEAPSGGRSPGPSDQASRAPGASAATSAAPASPTAALTPAPDALAPGGVAPATGDLDAPPDPTPGDPDTPPGTTAPASPRPSEACDVAFLRIDADEDKVLSQMELLTVGGYGESYDAMVALVAQRDRDGDGKLTFDEWCPGFVQPSLPPCSTWFAQLDTNNNGEVSLGEAEWADRGKPSGPNVARFRELDTNNNGKLVLLLACGVYPSGAPITDTCDARFDYISRGNPFISDPAYVYDYDRNGDGMVDRSEFAEVCFRQDFPCSYQFRNWSGPDLVITLDEAMKQGWTASLFARRDKDGDGKVVITEFCDPNDR
ncbi:MAG: hypothetical protein VKS61_12510 [Candidatus Sericytochromatia bacterium]|nr:hypothetical protein [Candidatus Sericytochromatia bacterium]